MSFMWNAQGPAFEWPTCYRIENRFLTLRAALLFAFAVAILWVALSEPEPAGPAAAAVRQTVERGSSVPHVLVGLLLLALGGLDVWAAARQRRLLLQPGEPASLTPDPSRQGSSGASATSWLQRLFNDGVVPKHDLRGTYRRPLLALVPELGRAPVGLQAHLRLRLAHLLLAGGLLLILGLSWAVAASRPGALALAALWYLAIAAALVARNTWIAKAAPGPLVVAAVLAVALAGGLVVGVFADKVPQVQNIQRLGLPPGAAAVLASLLLIEGLALLAGRAQAGRSPPLTPPPAAVINAEIAADAGRVQQELERELQSCWNEGVPNRRYSRRAPAVDARTAVTAVNVLEETQPTLPSDERDRDHATAASRQIWLLALCTLGLLLTVAGGVLLVRLAHAHMLNGAAPWTPATAAVGLVVAGGYAIQAGHLLWSRVEVESSLYGIDLAGAAGARTSQLRVRVMQVLSVFYAAAEHPIGSRTLWRLAANDPAAQRLVDQVKAYAERQSLTGAAAPKERIAAPAAGGTGRPAATAPFSPQPALPRFCAACGNPVQQAGRFCQYCGATLLSG